MKFERKWWRDLCQIWSMFVDVMIRAGERIILLKKNLELHENRKFFRKFKTYVKIFTITFVSFIKLKKNQ